MPCLAPGAPCPGLPRFVARHVPSSPRAESLTSSRARAPSLSVSFVPCVRRRLSADVVRCASKPKCDVCVKGRDIRGRDLET